MPDGLFYSAAVQWAADNGITTGVGNTGLFQPEANVTRGQMVTFLERLNDLRDASSLPQEPIVVDAPPESLQPYGDFTANVTRWAGFIRVESDQVTSLVMGLPGPQSFGAVDYVPQSVQYCQGQNSTGTINQATVWGNSDSLSNTQVGSNGTDLVGNGCLSVSLTEVVANPGIILSFDTSGGTVSRVVRVRTTWVPADEFAPASVDLAPAEQQADQEG